MKNHFLDYWPVYLIGLAVVLLIGGMCLYEYYYPCVSGHYEEVWHNMYDGNGNFMGGYFMDEFVCDCRTERK